MSTVNEYVFMVQARGIQIRENVKNIGAQVLEQVVRGAYSINGTDYTYDFNMSESDAPPTTYLPEGFTYLPSQVCPERLPYMKGRLEVNMSEISLEEVERSLLEEESIAPGGYWKPKDCLPRWKVAILVPFRNRHEHLPILLRHLVPVLQKQRLHFAFYFIEQGGTEPFNRAMLFNVGYKEAMKDLDWDCLIFHDVDHLMENDRNYYGCTDMPRHFAVKLDKYSYMYSLLRHSKERQKVDGLNNLNYSALVARRPLYTNITVSLSRKLAPIADY
ncbi:Beta-1 [Nibea albiflora]|uniref:Beta-1 n=1 Tax=Nibea albiflora TaxID=240163 RepID=A0ACB7EK58_NIBAL|nr:Beta-1 [Nibea albiflora]